MDLFVLAFIKSALLHLGAGVVLGLSMSLWPRGGLTVHQLLPAHAHLMVIGWLSMIVFGVAYHVLPRFSGRPLRFPRMAWAHFVLSHLGLWGMVVGFVLVRTNVRAGPLVLGAGASLQAAGLALFILNLWITLPTWSEMRKGY